MSAEELGFDPTLKKKKKKKVPTEAGAAIGASGADDMDALFAGAKKKKHHKKAAEGDAEASGDAPADAGALDFGGMKKKKKKKHHKKEAAGAAAAGDDFEKALAEAGVSTEAAPADQQAESFLPYADLLDRFYKVLSQNNPELAGGQHQKLKIPPPEVARDGNKKTVFVNVQVIAHVLQRSPEHLIQYLFAELGTSGSIDGEKRLIIKGRYQAKNIESVLRRYIQEYVICKTCKSMNTELKRESTNRLHFIVCKACGSTKSVSSIKTGYQAHVGANRRKRV